MKKKYFSIIVIISFCLVFIQVENALAVSSSASKNTVVAKKNDAKQYESKKLKIAFTYPKDWGTINQKIENSFDSSFSTCALNIGKEKTNFLSGVKKIIDEGFGTDSWELKALSINSQKDIEKYCSLFNAKCPARDKSDWCKERKGKEKCELKKNSAGIKFVKVKEVVTHLGEEKGSVETNYFIFNPKSEYKGIIISTESLKMKKITNLVGKLDSLVGSLRFIK